MCRVFIDERKAYIGHENQVFPSMCVTESAADPADALMEQTLVIENLPVNYHVMLTIPFLDSSCRDFFAFEYRGGMPFGDFSITEWHDYNV